MTESIKNAPACIPPGVENSPARASDATGVRALCLTAAGVVLDAPGSVTIVGVGTTVHVPKYRVPSAAELDMFQRVVRLVPHGGGFTTTMTEDELAAALNELRPPWTEKPKHVVEVTVMPMMAPSAGVTMPVETAALAAYLNEVGERSVVADVADLQLLLGRATGGSSRDIESVHGFVADLDYIVEDPAKEHVVRGAPVPNVVFATESGGARLLYVFESPFAPSAAEFMEKRIELFHALNVALPALDPSSLKIEQRQYVPMFIRTTKGPRRVVSRIAIPISAQPLNLAQFAPSLPSLVLDALGLGAGLLGDAERDEVTTYLAALGVALPLAGGITVSRCPIKQHSARKVLVGRGKRGTIYCRCLGGHGGAGQKSWTEHDLLRLARGGAS